uniref:Uncharacterized protein n=1 Tax=Arundo donax TaxID=35708 RepID=A0A0A9H9A1_ARUDO
MLLPSAAVPAASLPLSTLVVS